MAKEVMIEVDGAMLVLTINRPEKRNAINDAVLSALVAGATRYADDDALSLLVIRAKGGYFSAGGDFNSGLFPDIDALGPRGMRDWLLRSDKSLGSLTAILERVGKPVLVVHQGPCFGGALEISLACDFRIAAESARYSLPEGRIGALPSAGGSARLTRLVGPHWARWLLMAGQTITATKAEAIGLVHAVFPDEQLEAEVGRLCRDILSMPREAAAAAKLTIELAADLGPEAGRNLERMVASGLVFGPEYRNLVEAARERMASKPERG
ncbi:Enoyl-CoA hydratase/carnithine racemase [Sphingopyxis sp. YR583]|uniref:enoyl-CoA hydratase/isomerase family protein n=1 Tax=Sphingopyxis sp. YR583 TaxID=1881047 RepID=UPI0008A79EFD|nr:enoyl-CoA hydratase/isomerase family protein [Sphingopyxis sp. YR583]SEH19179.1 Enoyl-CoA hydratase/carnithine racemase [Sphingopyxis sp. YR583]